MLLTALLLIPSFNPVVKELNRCIHHLQPYVDDEFSEYLAKDVYYWAKLNHSDPYMALAQAMQESSMDPDKIGPQGDIGLFQIHPSTARNYHLDWLRLHFDVDYQVQSYFVVLKDKMNYCHDVNAFSCYHSFTEEERKIYEKDVLKFFNIDPMSKHRYKRRG